MVNWLLVQSFGWLVQAFSWLRSLPLLPLLFRRSHLKTKGTRPGSLPCGDWATQATPWNLFRICCKTPNIWLQGKWCQDKFGPTRSRNLNIPPCISGNGRCLSFFLCMIESRIIFVRGGQIVHAGRKCGLVFDSLPEKVHGDKTFLAVGRG